MCRNIKTLYNFKPPASDQEIRDAALQFVRKLTGFQRPSQANEQIFDHAVEHIFRDARELLNALTTSAAPRNREAVAARARERAKKRYGMLP